MLEGSWMDRVTHDNTTRNSSALSVQDVLWILNGPNGEKSSSSFINTSDMKVVGVNSPRTESFPRRIRGQSSSESSTNTTTKSVAFNRAVRVRVYPRRSETSEQA
mmetsp:Transcript_6930/g.14789  ORF Transcript_6930/g.14789 Transcript_6930/m.14789 type:complete len:105 (+) Transcript_6930:128-442(+)